MFVDEGITLLGRKQVKEARIHDGSERPLQSARPLGIRDLELQDARDLER